MHKTWLLLLPELAGFAPEQRAHALRQAAHTPLDVPELVALAVAVVTATALTRYGLVDTSAVSRLLAALVNFGVALPLIALCAAPVHLRRLRRGLRHQLELHGGHD